MKKATRSALEVLGKRRQRVFKYRMCPIQRRSTSGALILDSSSSMSESHTRVLKVEVAKIGHFVFKDLEREFRDDWELQSSQEHPDAMKLNQAALLIRETDIPVAFPTETVYGLGADATRSSAVRGIYNAKQRPSDNPLIVHISSLSQLRRLLMPGYSQSLTPDPIPDVYHPLIERFWPGPLTVLLPLPKPSPFASEVTAGLPTVGVRMPASRLALALIQTAGVPLAAPSANASGKPSPTTAAHVLHDLDGRIDLILDGGACDVGVESTVVDGLSRPPAILRPGGVSIEMLRLCPGWEDVRIGYKDMAQPGGVPRAPGMKYKHYSPKAKVLLFRESLDPGTVRNYGGDGTAVGMLTTSNRGEQVLSSLGSDVIDGKDGNLMLDLDDCTSAKCRSLQLGHGQGNATTIWAINLGPAMIDIARGLFSALRELDSKGVSVIFVESVDESIGDTAAAVMNRLRKAAESVIEN